MIDDSQLVATLLDSGVADQATLDRGLRQTQVSGKSLYETLLTAELVAEPALVEAVGRLLELPTRVVTGGEIASDVRDVIPASMARRNRVVPLEKDDDGALILAMLNPSDRLAIDEIASHTGTQIRPILIGPRSLAAAQSEVYGNDAGLVSDSEAAIEALDGIGDGDYLDGLAPPSEWSDVFESSAADDLEDSAVLSRDMQDRPSTDVLADEDVDAAVADADAEPDEEDLPEIEIIEELGQPIRRRPPSPYASLEQWQVDGAIDGRSEIIMSDDADEFFTPTSITPLGNAEEDDQEEDIVDETMNLSADSESGTDALRPDSHTALGVGVNELEGLPAGQARSGAKKPLPIAKAQRTEVGRMGAQDSEHDDTSDTGAAAEDDATGVVADDDTSAAPPPVPDEPDEPPPSAKPAAKKSAKATAKPAAKKEVTDYRALGRAILKSGKQKKKEAEEAEKAKAKAREEEAKQKIRVALFEDDDEEFKEPVKATHGRGVLSDAVPIQPAERRPRTASSPGVDDAPVPEGLSASSDAVSVTEYALPEEFDTHAFLRALIELLVSRELLTVEEIVGLASTYTDD